MRWAFTSGMQVATTHEVDAQRAADCAPRWAGVAPDLMLPPSLALCNTPLHGHSLTAPESQSGERESEGSKTAASSARSYGMFAGPALLGIIIKHLVLQQV